ncbi:MAG: competence/damage-inducible protein A [Acidobacteriota bacterium]
MTAEIITIGDELLIGQVVNTNQAYIAEQLNAVGLYVEKMTTIGDNERDILEAFEAAMSRADCVCVTGGLGPTHDDITKAMVCEFFKTDLVLNEEVLSDVKELLSRRKIAWRQSAHDQAMVPRTCTVMRNKNGTAPGMMFETEGKYFFSMPGVPYEMRGMVDDFIVPFFRSKNLEAVVLHRTLKTTGIAESLLAEKIGNVRDVIGDDGSVTLAFLPNPLGTKLRITVRETSRSAAEEKLLRAEAAIRAKAEQYIYSSDERGLEDVINELMRERSLTLATAESCTGGMIADRITNVPGASEFFLRGFVAYSNLSKTEELGVDPALIEQYGAVSRETAEAMARGAREISRADIALSTTGIAGPTGGSPEKPVGTVWIGYSDVETTFALQFNYGDHRLRFKERTSQAALELLRRKLLKIDIGRT